MKQWVSRNSCLQNYLCSLVKCRWSHKLNQNLWGRVQVSLVQMTGTPHGEIQVNRALIKRGRVGETTQESVTGDLVLPATMAAPPSLPHLCLSPFSLPAFSSSVASSSLNIFTGSCAITEPRLWVSCLCSMPRPPLGIIWALAGSVEGPGLQCHEQWSGACEVDNHTESSCLASLPSSLLGVSFLRQGKRNRNPDQTEENTIRDEMGSEAKGCLSGLHFHY